MINHLKNFLDGVSTVQQQNTDSPLIPVAQLERLHEFRPDLVDWVIQQTQANAEHRKSENNRVNCLIFIKRIIGQICAFSSWVRIKVRHTKSAMLGITQGVQGLPCLHTPSKASLALQHLF